MEEILTLLRENNEMLKRLCAYVDKVDSDNYRMNEDMKQFAINMSANKASEMIEQNQLQGQLSCINPQSRIYW